MSTDERQRWALEQLAKDGSLIAKWALGHTDMPELTIQRLNVQYAKQWSPKKEVVSGREA